MNRIGTLVVAALVVGTAACTKHSGKPAAAAPQQQQNVLNSAFGSMDSRYSSKDTTLASQVEGIDATMAHSNPAINGSIGLTSTPSFELMMTGVDQPIQISSPSLDGKAYSGQPVDCVVQNSDSVRAALKGELSARSRCLDPNCVRIGLLLTYVPDSTQGNPSSISQKPVLAGYIFSHDGKTGYQLENANLQISSVADASAKREAFAKKSGDQKSAAQSQPAQKPEQIIVGGS